MTAIDYINYYAIAGFIIIGLTGLIIPIAIFMFAMEYLRDHSERLDDDNDLYAATILFFGIFLLPTYLHFVIWWVPFIVKAAETVI